MANSWDNVAALAWGREYDAIAHFQVAIKRVIVQFLRSGSSLFSANCQAQGVLCGDLVEMKINTCGVTLLAHPNKANLLELLQRNGFFHIIAQSRAQTLNSERRRGMVTEYNPNSEQASVVSSSPVNFLYELGPCCNQSRSESINILRIKRMEDARPISGSLMVRSISRGAVQRARRENLRIPAENLAGASSAPGIAVLKFQEHVEVFDSLLRRRIHVLQFEERVLAVCSHGLFVYVLTSDGMIARFDLEILRDGYPVMNALSIKESILRGSTAVVPLVMRGGVISPGTSSDVVVLQGSIGIRGELLCAVIQTKKGWFAFLNSESSSLYAHIASEPTALLYHEECLLFALGGRIYACNNEGSIGTVVNHRGFVGKEITALRFFDHSSLVIGFSDGNIVIYDVSKREISKSFMASLHNGSEASIFDQTQIHFSEKGCNDAQLIVDGRIIVLFQENLIILDAVGQSPSDVQNCSIFGVSHVKGLIFVDGLLCLWGRDGIYQVMLDGVSGNEAKEAEPISIGVIEFPESKKICTNPGREKTGIVIEELSDGINGHLADEVPAKRSTMHNDILDYFLSDSSEMEELERPGSEEDQPCIQTFQSRPRIIEESTENLKQLMSFRSDIPLGDFKSVTRDPKPEDMRKLIISALSGRETYLEYSRLKEQAISNQEQLDALYGEKNRSTIAFGEKATNSVVVQLGSQERHFQSVEQYIQFEKTAISDFKAQQRKAAEYRTLLVGEKTIETEEKVSIRPRINEAPIERITCQGRSPIPLRLQEAYALRNSDHIAMDESLSVSYVKPPPDETIVRLEAKTTHGKYASFPVTQQTFSYKPRDIFQILSTDAPASDPVTQVDMTEFACQLIEVERSERDPLVVRQLIAQFLAKRLFKKIPSDTGEVGGHHLSKELVEMCFEALERRLNDSSGSIDFDHLLKSSAFNAIERRLRNNSRSDEGIQSLGGSDTQNNPFGAWGGGSVERDYTKILSQEQRERLEAGYGNRSMRLILEELQKQGISVDFAVLGDSQREKFAEFIQAHVLTADLNSDEFRSGERIHELAQLLLQKLSIGTDNAQLVDAQQVGVQCSAARVERIERETLKAREKVEANEFQKTHECPLRDLSYYQLLDVLNEVKFDLNRGVMMADGLFAVYNELGKCPRPRERGEERGFRVALTASVKVKAESMKYYIDNVLAVQMLMLARDRSLFDRYATAVLPHVRATLIAEVLDKLHRYLLSVLERLADIGKEQKMALAEIENDERTASSPLLALFGQSAANAKNSKSVAVLQKYDAGNGELFEINKQTRKNRKSRVNGPIRYEKRQKSENELVSSKMVIGDGDGEHIDYSLQGGKIKGNRAQHAKRILTKSEIGLPAESSAQDLEFEELGSLNKFQEQESRLPPYNMELDLGSQVETTATSVEPLTEASEGVASSSSMHEARSKRLKTNMVDLAAQLGAVELAARENKRVRTSKKGTFPAGFRQAYPSTSSIQQSSTHSIEAPEIGLEDLYEADEEEVIESSTSCEDSPGTDEAVKRRKLPLTTRERQLLKLVGRKDPNNLESFKNAPKELFRSRSIPNLQYFKQFQPAYLVMLAEDKPARVFRREQQRQLQPKESRFEQLITALVEGTASVSPFISDTKRLNAFLTEQTVDSDIYSPLSRFEEFIHYYGRLDKGTDTQLLRSHSARSIVWSNGPRKLSWRRETQRVDVFSTLILFTKRIHDDECLTSRETALFKTYKRRKMYLHSSPIMIAQTSYQTLQLAKKASSKEDSLAIKPTRPFEAYFNSFTTCGNRIFTRRVKELEDIVSRNFPRLWAYRHDSSAPKYYLANELQFAMGNGGISGAENLDFYKVSFNVLQSQRLLVVDLPHAKLNCAEFSNGIEILEDDAGMDTTAPDASPAFLFPAGEFCISKGLELLSTDHEQFTLAAAAKSVFALKEAELRKSLPQPLRGEADLSWNALNALFMVHRQDRDRENRRKLRSERKYIRREERKAQKTMQADIPVRPVYSKLYYERGRAHCEESGQFEIFSGYLQLYILYMCSVCIVDELSFAFAQSGPDSGLSASNSWNLPEMVCKMPICVGGLKFSISQKILQEYIQYMQNSISRQTEQQRENNRLLQIQALRDSGNECLELNLGLATFQKCIDCSIRFNIYKWDEFSRRNENRKVLEVEAARKRELELQRLKEQQAADEERKKVEDAIEAEHRERDDLQAKILSVLRKDSNYITCGLELFLVFLGLSGRFSREFYDEILKQMAEEPDFELQKYEKNLLFVELSLEVLRRQFYYNQRYSFYAIPFAKEALGKTQEALSFTFSFRNIGRLALSGTSNCGIAEFSQGVINQRDFRNKMLLETLEINEEDSKVKERRYFSAVADKAQSPIRKELHRKMEKMLRVDAKKSAFNGIKMQGVPVRPSSQLLEASSRGDIRMLQKLAENHEKLLQDDLTRLADSDELSEEPEAPRLDLRVVNNNSQTHLLTSRSVRQNVASQLRPLDIKLDAKHKVERTQEVILQRPQRSSLTIGTECLQLDQQTLHMIRGGAVSQLQNSKPAKQLERQLESAIGHRPRSGERMAPRPVSRAEEVYKQEKCRSDAGLVAIGRNVTK